MPQSQVAEVSGTAYRPCQTFVVLAPKKRRSATRAGGVRRGRQIPT